MNTRPSYFLLYASLTLLGGCSLLNKHGDTPGEEAPREEVPPERPIYSSSAREDDRQPLPNQELILEQSPRPRRYADKKPGVSPLVITPSRSADHNAWMASDPTWESVRAALVLDNTPQYNTADSQLRLGNAVDGELIGKGIAPVDRSLPEELEREVWLNSFSASAYGMAFAQAIAGTNIRIAGRLVLEYGILRLPSTALGWKPMLSLDTESNWVSVLNGGRSTETAGPRGGFLISPQVILELDGPTFESNAFEVPVMLLEGQVEEWISVEPHRIRDNTKIAMGSAINGVLGGEFEGSELCFMDPNTGSFWGLTGLYKETSLRIDEFMHWKYGHLLPEHLYCGKCGALRDEANALELPAEVKRSYEALEALIATGASERESIVSPMVQDLIKELEAVLRPTTPWQELNSAVPHVPPVWKCPECDLVRHVEFLIGYHPASEKGTTCEVGDWNTYATWGGGVPNNGAYRVLSPSALTLVNGFTRHKGNLDPSEVIAAIIEQAESSKMPVAVVQNGQVILVPSELVTFHEQAAICDIPTFDHKGSQLYRPLKQSSHMTEGSVSFLDRRASIGCRIIETESSRVLGVAHLQLSFREVMPAPFQIPVTEGQVVVDKWIGAEDQDRALTLALAKDLVSLLPLNK